MRSPPIHFEPFISSSLNENNSNDGKSFSSFRVDTFRNFFFSLFYYSSRFQKLKLFFIFILPTVFGPNKTITTRTTSMKTTTMITRLKPDNLFEMNGNGLHHQGSNGLIKASRKPSVLITASAHIPVISLVTSSPLKINMSRNGLSMPNTNGTKITTSLLNGSNNHDSSSSNKLNNVKTDRFSRFSRESSPLSQNSNSIEQNGTRPASKTSMVRFSDEINGEKVRLFFNHFSTLRVRQSFRVQSFTVF
jgi:hypothetical protein